MRSRQRRQVPQIRLLGHEILEDRTVLAAEALGPEFLVNTVEVGSQTVAQKPNTVAMDDVGNFVVVWQSNSQVYAQRFNRDGQKVGGEIDVSGQSTALSEPVVAMNDNGDFTVAWTAASDDSSGQNGTGTGVYARSYSSQGTPYQTWYRVNETTAGNQNSPSVSMDNAGRVVFAFQSSGGSGDVGTDIYVRSFQVQTPIPTVAMSQRRVNTSVTSGEQTNPSIAVDEQGSFVVAWVGSDANGTGIRTKIYTAAGSAVTGEVIANTYTTGNQFQPVVALSPAADLSTTLTARYYVAWSGPGTGDTTDGGIYFRRMGLGALPNEIRANVFTAGFQIQPTIAVDYLGGVAVAWTSQFQDGSNFGVYARYFEHLPNGQLQGDAADRLVNSFTFGVQYLPSIAMDDDGDFVIAYAGEGLLDPSPLGIYARRYSSFIDDDAPQVLGVHSVTTVNILDASTPSQQISEEERLISSFNQIRVQFSEAINTASMFVLLNRDGVHLVDAFSAQSGTVFNPATQTWEARFQLTEPLVTGYYTLEVLTANDLTGISLDGDNDGAPGGVFRRDFFFAPPEPDGNAVSVSNSSAYEGDVAVTNEGVTIVTWAESVNNFLADTIYYQLFDRNNVPLTAPLIANTPTGPFRRHPKVATADSGNFLITWWAGSSGSTNKSEARLFDATGAPLTSVFEPASVDTVTFGSGRAYIAMAPSGEFVLAWTGFGRSQPNGQDGSGASVMARRFNASGTPIGSEFLVNTLTTGDQFVRSVAMGAQGNFVVVWESVDAVTSIKSVRGRRFDAAGTALGNDFAISSNTTRDQEQPQVAMDADGNFVVVWQDDVGNFVGDNVILARRYNAWGIPDGAAFDVSPPLADGSFYSESLAMDADGDFAITYVGNFQTLPGVFQIEIGTVWFDPTGLPLRQLTIANGLADVSNSEPQVAMTADGDTVVAWRRDPAIDDGISFLRFSAPRDLVWRGTDGRDVVTFIELPDGTIQVTETMLDSVVVNNTSYYDNIKGRIIAFGEDGNDNIVATQVNTRSVIVHGGSGLDLILGGSANDRLYGGDSADSLSGGLGNDLIYGGQGDDLVFGEVANPDEEVTYGKDSIFGEEGDDVLYGDGDGGEGAADVIDGGSGNDKIYGDGKHGSEDGNDRILAGDGNDTVYADRDGGEGGNDTVYGGWGDDLLFMGGGNDFADGENDNDLILGGDGAEGANDTLRGSNGRDLLVGDFGHFNNDDDGAGADDLNGGAGEDIVIAGAYFPETLAVLLAIQSEWVSNRTFAERTANIAGTGVGPRDNGNEFLTPGVNVFNDKPATGGTPLIDQVFGGTDQDWIVLDLSEDVAGDADNSDLLVDLFFYPLPASP